MNSTDREKFWDVLNNLHSADKESIKPLVAASPWPKYLCRFRPVTEHSLQQLNENKLFYSSADNYDDPFDTYFYINIDQMVLTYEEMQNELKAENKDFIETLHKVAMFAGQSPDVFVNMLSTNSLDFPNLRGQLTDVRSSIQKSLFSICFCEDPYNETLWLKYAGNYSGFVQVYDMENQSTIICGKEENCRNCASAKALPNIYPVYYSDTRYDATKYALGVVMLDRIRKQADAALDPLCEYVKSSLLWEPERVSLIKKKCHEHDQEWRMIRPIMSEQRSFIKMKPCTVIIGLRTPDYESRLIVSAAVNAGINDIRKLFINDSDELDSKPVPTTLYRV